ncbi:LysR substrate-binding domain-containing protein [Rhodobacteraceae bacterium KMM 6894]|nr:LysR substrate-binding domain-containing protein [Rhodobacteraceae bacterium KMM 6894]
MTRLPPLNALRAFDAAGKYLSFRAAADAMGVTQGAVAQQVRLLEAHLGIALFDRLPKGLALTTPGRGYHAKVAAAFQDLRAATQVLTPEPDRVVISVTPTFAAKWLIPNLPAFSSAHPEIDLRILATEKVSSFHGDGIDLAVRQAKPPFGAAIAAIRLFEQDIIAVASPGFMQGHTVPMAPQALARMTKLHDAHDLWPAFLRAHDIEDDSGHGLRLSQTALAIDAALSGQGIALVSAFLVARDLAQGTLLQVTSTRLPGGQDFYLLTQTGPRRSAATDVVLKWLASKAAPGA